MEKEKSNEIGQKLDEMNSMDQGINIFAQILNNATGIDEGNDGKMEGNEVKPIND